MKRLNSVTLNNVGDSGLIDTELVALSLMSVNHINVEFNPFYFFDIFVELRPTQTQGSLLALRTGPSTVSFTTDLPMSANVMFQFVQVLDPSSRRSLPVDGTVHITEPWHATVVPEPGPAGLVASGLAGVVWLRLRRRRLEHAG